MFGLITTKKIKRQVMDTLSIAGTELYRKGDAINNKRIDNFTGEITNLKLKRKQVKALSKLAIQINEEANRVTPSVIKVKTLLDQSYDVAHLGKVNIEIEANKSEADKTMDQADLIKEEIVALEQELKAAEAKLNNKARKLEKTEFKQLVLRIKQLRTKIAMKNDDFDKYLKTNDNLYTADTLIERKKTNKEIADINANIDVTELKEAASVINQASEDIQSVTSEIDNIVGDVSNASNEDLDIEYEKYLEGKAMDKLDSEEPVITKTGSKAKEKSHN